MKAPTFLQAHSVCAIHAKTNRRALQRVIRCGNKITARFGRTGGPHMEVNSPGLHTPQTVRDTVKAVAAPANQRETSAPSGCRVISYSAHVSGGTVEPVRNGAIFKIIAK